MSRTRIILADDHQILAEGLRSLLEPEFEVVAVVANGQELVTAASKLRPHLIVADVSMPLMNGIEAVSRLRDLGSKAKVVFLTMQRDVVYARRALEAGAAGYVLKHSAASELVTAVREALQGRTYVTPVIANELLKSYQNPDPVIPDTEQNVTPRQREVLQLVAQGRSAKEIASLLKISIRTAEAHKARILETLGLHSTAELVQYAIRKGIITLD